MNSNVLVIHERDNVAIALEDIGEGAQVVLPGGEAFVALEKIPYSHKVALKDIPTGRIVRKYGETIGVAAVDIPRGAWVHTHNLAVEEGRP